jgi:predicted nuclease of predicted toxin-antitoxin system
MPLKFHLDENVNPNVAQELRRRGVEVTTNVEAGLTGRSDEDQLAFSAATARVLVTGDSDFLRLHNQGLRHSGLAFCHATMTVGEIVSALALMSDALRPEEMIQNLEFLRGLL